LPAESGNVAREAVERLLNPMPVCAALFVDDSLVLVL